MKLNSLTPNLAVKDVEKTVKFYTKVLGFEPIIALPEETPYEFALVAKDGIEIMFQTIESLTIDCNENFGQSFSGLLYIECDNSEEVYERLKDTVNVVKPIHETPYLMKEFWIKDINGTILAFAQRIL